MNGCILVVDDTPANIQTVAAILKEHGYQVSVATNGKQALAALERVRPDLILLDVIMPEMDGFETCRQLKSVAAWRDIPVIFLTAQTDVANIVQGFELGAVDYVAKPFQPHELLARVNTHVNADRLARENERLLLNVLPAPIAEQLKRQTGIIAQGFDDVSVLFADLVGFTRLSAQLNPAALIEMLNRVFSTFDRLAVQHGLEKIKTIGDAYMVAGGLPEPQPNHLHAMAAFALETRDALEDLAGAQDGLSLRIGMHVGSVVAGVIGTQKFTYDIWGDTVNTASRLESQGLPGRIHVSEAVYLRLHDAFAFEPRGTIELRGKGPINAYFLEAPLVAAAVDRG
ncbi:MAG TPA: adenylate/guanylate cyclase domain-containing protein [Chloroflexota bacterium]|jgi:class 3 adenylate cyclase